MSKLPSILALAVTTSLLLVGCSTSPSGEPAASTPAASDSPSTVPTPEETPEKTQSAEAEETAEPSTEPSPEPSDEPATEATEAPESPVPTIEPLPTAPGDPFVPPPHGEPNPHAPGSPFVPPPHGEPNPFAGNPMSNTVTPDPVWGAAGIVVQAGTTFTVTGSGYQPGQRIVVFFGPAQSDHSFIGDQSTYADASGNYSFPITLSPGFPSGAYGVMTSTPDGLSSGAQIDATRRWAAIEVVAP